MKLSTRVTRILAFGFWVWSAFIAWGAGFVGTGLNCEGGEGCKSGSPSWLQPWTWGEYDVFPEAAYVGLVGLVASSAFVLFVLHRRPHAAAAAFAASVALLSYPFFAGLTPSGRGTFVFGPLLALASLARLAWADRAAGRRNFTSSL